MRNNNDYLNLICMSIFAAVFLALVASIPCAIKAKQTISQGVQQDLDKTIAKHNQ